MIKHPTPAKPSTTSKPSTPWPGRKTMTGSKLASLAVRGS